MKTFTNFILMVFLTALCGTNQLFAQQWWTVGSPHFTTGCHLYLLLAVDGNGTPYVAYDDGDADGFATVKKFDGSNWQVVGSAGFATNYTANISLAIDGSGIPYFANAEGGKVTVRKYFEGSWQVVGSPVSDPAGKVPLAIDGSGIPYVAYTEVGKVTVRKYFEGSWQVVGSSFSTTYYTTNISLAIDGSGVPYIVYDEQIGPAFVPTVMKYTGNGTSGWETVGTTGISIENSPCYSSIAIDGSGTPYVAYRDADDSYRATVIKYSGGSWQVLGTFGGQSTQQNRGPSIVIDGNGTPYVAYDDDGLQKLTVMKYSGSGTNWDNLGSDGISAGTSSDPSIVISPNGIPVVVYQDPTDPDLKASAMKFSESADEPLYTPTVQASNITFSNIMYNNFTINWTNGNGYRRAVFVKQAGSGTTAPTDYTTYTANTTFGNGTEIGSGWYCVYNDTGTSVTVSGLSASTDYIAQVFEYSGQTYLTATAADNPQTTTTAAQTNYALQFASGKYAYTDSPSNTIEDLTLECRVNYNGFYGNDEGIIYNGSGNGYGVYIRRSGDCAAHILMSGVNWSGQFIALPVNTWTHLALVHTSGGDWTLYVNGESRVVMSNTPIVPSGDFSLGANFNGQIDEVRFSNVARYTSNFTPPTLPFTTDANTIALYNFDEGRWNSILRCFRKRLQSHIVWQPSVG